jgi:hypothetical protein
MNPSTLSPRRSPLSGHRLTFAASVGAASRRTVVVMSQYMAWPTGDGVWHIGTGLTLPPGAGLADLNELLTRRHIERAQIGFHRPNDEAKFNDQFATAID